MELEINDIRKIIYHFKNNEWRVFKIRCRHCDMIYTEKHIDKCLVLNNNKDKSNADTSDNNQG